VTIWRNKKNFKTGFFLCHSLSFKAYEMYITAVFTHLVSNCTKTKIYDIHLRLRLIL